MVVGEGPLGLVLLGLMERNGIAALKSTWSSKHHLQRQVCLNISSVGSNFPVLLTFLFHAIVVLIAI